MVLRDLPVASGLVFRVVEVTTADTVSWVGVSCARLVARRRSTSRGPGAPARLDLCVLPADHPCPRGFPTTRSRPALDRRPAVLQARLSQVLAWPVLVPRAQPRVRFHRLAGGQRWPLLRLPLHWNLLLSIVEHKCGLWEAAEPAEHVAP